MPTVKRNALHGNIQNTVDYISQDYKTNDEELVSGIDCEPSTAAEQMKMTQRKFKKKEDQRVGYHVIQSFSLEDNITPQQAHEIGIKTAKELYPDFEIVVATHVDRLHLHNHIVINSVNAKTGKKLEDRLANEKEGLYALRKVSDKIAKDYGCKILSGQEKIPLYKKQKYRYSPSMEKEQIKKDINESILKSDNINELLEILISEGYDIRNKNTISVKSPNSKGFIQIEKMENGEYKKSNIQRFYDLGKPSHNNKPLLEYTDQESFSNMIKKEDLKNNVGETIPDKRSSKEKLKDKNKYSKEVLATSYNKNPNEYDNTVQEQEKVLYKIIFAEKNFIKKRETEKSYYVRIPYTKKYTYIAKSRLGQNANGKFIFIDPSVEYRTYDTELKNISIVTGEDLINEITKTKEEIAIFLEKKEMVRNINRSIYKNKFINERNEKRYKKELNRIKREKIKNRKSIKGKKNFQGQWNSSFERVKNNSSNSSKVVINKITPRRKDYTYGTPYRPPIKYNCKNYMKAQSVVRQKETKRRLADIEVEIQTNLINNYEQKEVEYISNISNIPNISNNGINEMNEIGETNIIDDSNLIPKAPYIPGMEETNISNEQNQIEQSSQNDQRKQVLQNNVHNKQYVNNIENVQEEQERQATFNSDDFFSSPLDTSNGSDVSNNSNNSNEQTITMPTNNNQTFQILDQTNNEKQNNQNIASFTFDDIGMNETNESNEKNGNKEQNNLNNNLNCLNNSSNENMNNPNIQNIQNNLNAQDDKSQLNTLENTLENISKNTSENITKKIENNILQNRSVKSKLDLYQEKVVEKILNKYDISNLKDMGALRMQLMIDIDNMYAENKKLNRANGYNKETVAEVISKYKEMYGIANRAMDAERNGDMRLKKMYEKEIYIYKGAEKYLKAIFKVPDNEKLDFNMIKREYVKIEEYAHTIAKNNAQIKQKSKELNTMNDFLEKNDIEKRSNVVRIDFARKRISYSNKDYISSNNSNKSNNSKNNNIENNVENNVGNYKYEIPKDKAHVIIPYLGYIGEFNVEDIINKSGDACHLYLDKDETYTLKDDRGNDIYFKGNELYKRIEEAKHRSKEKYKGQENNQADNIFASDRTRMMNALNEFEKKEKESTEKIENNDIEK